MKKKAVFKDKYYTHFDCKKNHKKYIKLITNSEWVGKHGFYPFIYFKIVFNKFGYDEDYGERRVKDKERNIMKSAHIDRYIYQYYANQLNDYYNNICRKMGIDRSVIAYRNNKKGKSNIHYAKEVLEFISKKDKAIILVADFSKYFDTINHEYLKKQLCQCLGVERLPNDWYSVYKSMTKYAYVKQEDIETYLNKPYNELRRLDKYFSTQEFHTFKKSYLIKNKNDYGIPQGSSISAVLSNVYLLEFDKELNNFATTNNGLYRRYCDDIVLVIHSEDNVDEVIDRANKKLTDVKNTIPNLIINEDKTETYAYDGGQVNRVRKIGGKGHEVHYLGFSFDGKHVRIREKSLFKYYSRAYKKIRIYHKYKGNPVDEYAIRKTIYKKYSHLGTSKYISPKKGNFITYANKAHNIFDDSQFISSNIRNQVKRHWTKIHKRLRHESSSQVSSQTAN